MSVDLLPACWTAFNMTQIHARLGEMQYMAAVAAGGGEALNQRYLAEALKRFCRSIELCDDYLRAYYGLKLVSMLLCEVQTCRVADVIIGYLSDTPGAQQSNKTCSR